MFTLILSHINRHRKVYAFLLATFIFNQKMKAQTYALFTIGLGTPKDTTTIKKGTDSLFHKAGNTYTFIGVNNPRVYSPFFLIPDVDSVTNLMTVGRSLDSMGNRYTKAQSNSRYPAMTDTGVFVMTFTRAGHAIDSLGTLIAARLNILDTANMLANYAKTAALNLKVFISDTASMLSRYLRKIDTASLSAKINLKNNISDTAAMLLPYLRKADASAKTDTLFTPTLSTGVRLSTTKNFLLNIYVTVGIASALVGNNQGNLTLSRSSDNVTFVACAYAPTSMLGVLSTSTQTVQLSMLLPAGYYYKITPQSVGC